MSDWKEKIQLILFKKMWSIHPQETLTCMHTEVLTAAMFVNTQKRNNIPQKIKHGVSI